MHHDPAVLVLAVMTLSRYTVDAPAVWTARWRASAATGSVAETAKQLTLNSRSGPAPRLDGERSVARWISWLALRLASRIEGHVVHLRTQPLFSIGSGMRWTCTCVIDRLIMYDANERAVTHSKRFS